MKLKTTLIGLFSWTLVNTAITLILLAHLINLPTRPSRDRSFFDAGWDAGRQWERQQNPDPPPKPVKPSL